MRKSIQKAIRIQVWNEYIGEEIGKTVCFCCKKREISQAQFHCGHVIAVAKGGSTCIDNLRPVCELCNKSMGTENMDDFCRKMNGGEILTKSKQPDNLPQKCQTETNPGENANTKKVKHKSLPIDKNPKQETLIHKIPPESFGYTFPDGHILYKNNGKVYSSKQIRNFTNIPHLVNNIESSLVTKFNYIRVKGIIKHEKDKYEVILEETVTIVRLPYYIPVASRKILKLEIGNNWYYIWNDDISKRNNYVTDMTVDMIDSNKSHIISSVNSKSDLYYNNVHVINRTNLPGDYSYTEIMFIESNWGILHKARKQFISFWNRSLAK